MRRGISSALLILAVAAFVALFSNAGVLRQRRERLRRIRQERSVHCVPRLLHHIDFRPDPLGGLPSGRRQADADRLPAAELGDCLLHQHLRHHLRLPDDRQRPGDQYRGGTRSLQCPIAPVRRSSRCAPVASGLWRPAPAAGVESGGDFAAQARRRGRCHDRRNLCGFRRQLCRPGARAQRCAGQGQPELCAVFDGEARGAVGAGGYASSPCRRRARTPRYRLPTMAGNW